MVKKIILAITICICILSASANLLITEVSYEGIAQMYSSQVETALKDSASASGYTIVEREIEGISDDNFEKYLKKGKLKNAQVLLNTSVKPLGENLVISLSLINMEQGTTYYQASITLSPDDMVKLTEKVTEKMTESQDKLDLGAGVGAGSLTAAVLDFEAQGCPKMEAVILTDLLREKMIKYGKFTIIDRANMKAILEEQSIQESGCTSEECKVQIGQLLNASRMISGTLRKTGDEYVLSVKMLDVGNAKIINMVKVDIKNIQNCAEEMEQAAKDIGESMEDRLKNIEKRRKRAARHVIAGVGGIALSTGGILMFHGLAGGSIDTLDTIFEDYRHSTITSEAVELGDTMDAEKEKAKNLYTMRDVMVFVSAALLSYEITALIKYIKLKKYYAAQKNLNLAFGVGREFKGIQVSFRF